MILFGFDQYDNTKLNYNSIEHQWLFDSYRVGCISIITFRHGIYKGYRAKL